MRRSRVLVVLIMLILLTAAGCGGGAQPGAAGGSGNEAEAPQPAEEAPPGSGGEAEEEPPEAPAAPVHVRFGVTLAAMNANFLPLAVAQAMGYFAEEGLDVEPIFISGSVPALQSMVSGQLDMTMPTPESVLAAVDQGADVVFVYNWVRAPVAKLGVLEDSPIQSLEDFRGKTIGVQSLGSGPVLLAQGVLRTVGIDPEREVEFLAVGLGAQALNALTTGEVDALMMPVSQYAVMENLGARLRYFAAPEQEKLFGTSFGAVGAELDEKAHIIAGVGRAFTKATVFTIHNPEAAVRMMYELYPTTRSADVPEEQQIRDHINIWQAQFEPINAGDPGSRREWGHYPHESVEAWVQFAYENGITQKLLDPSSLYTNRFVDAYNDFDVDAVAQQARDWAPAR